VRRRLAVTAAPSTGRPASVAACLIMVVAWLCFFGVAAASSLSSFCAFAFFFFRHNGMAEVLS